MDIIILIAVVLAGIAIESYISQRARRRAESDDRIVDEPGRSRDPDEE